MKLTNLLQKLRELQTNFSGSDFKNPLKILENAKDTTKLSKLLQQSKIIHTDLGKFEFEKELSKKGANSYVFVFKRICKNARKSYAIKFLKPTASTKEINRFQDEFFLIQQIPTHKNIAQYYHFDKVSVNLKNETYEYHIIIMNLYDRTLESIAQNNIFDENSEKYLKKIFYNLIAGLEHLHNQNFIHRDIKPDNILYDKENDCYVIADMGITKFSDDLPKLTKTENGDRVANWLFSPKEQVDSRTEPKKNWDIFALGQVIHWFVTGETIRGSHSNFNIFGDYKSDFCDIMKQFIKKSTDNDPKNRFQSIQEVRDFISQKEKRLNEMKMENLFWECFDDFDEIIRKNFSKINDIYEETDTSKINSFISDFNSLLSEYNNHFWAMDLKGGDFIYKQPIIDINNGFKLFWGYIEIDIERVIVYRNSEYSDKSFFILITKPLPHFQSDEYEYKGDCSFATYWIDKNIYLNTNETKNGYYETDSGDVISIKEGGFAHRLRYHTPYAFMVGLNKTPISIGVTSKEIIPQILQQALNGNLDMEIIDDFERKTRSDFADFIKNWR